MPVSLESPNTPIGLKVLGARRTDDTTDASTQQQPATPETGEAQPKSSP
jgi:hypothetical protein